MAANDTRKAAACISGSGTKVPQVRANAANPAVNSIDTSSRNPGQDARQGKDVAAGEAPDTLTGLGPHLTFRPKLPRLMVVV